MEEGLLFQRIINDLEAIYHLYYSLFHNGEYGAITHNESIFIVFMTTFIILWLIGISIAATIAIIKIPAKLDKLTKVLEKCLEDNGE